MSVFHTAPLIAIDTLAEKLADISSKKCIILEKDKYTCKIRILNSKDLFPFLRAIRDSAELSFEILIDICACDYPQAEKRFTLTYQFLSVLNNIRLSIFVDIAENEIVPSIHNLYTSANWLEREVYDLFGISFSNHPDLRRILTDYGFIGYPMRKDFPQSGHLELTYDHLKASVKYQKVNLSQPYRDMHFESPWHGTKYVLPGDEKVPKT